MSIFMRLSFVKSSREIRHAPKQTTGPSGTDVPYANANLSDEHSKPSMRCQRTCQGSVLTLIHQPLARITV
jgi:hypothetical protein